ncbi:MAG TPA: 2-oxoglutarate dehydrogenase complex dihydrolipoyllysine-residue succinyltransferase [Chloroflexota bacterium]|nr:2-oxoglutarate dehydrogenase complex dihydrolipoyllysine-residue succinyltransferase [Chloroflexota bacterium]
MPANVEVRVPVLGESIVDATVGAWLKREGEPVEAGEALVQLETEKVNVDVAADQAGVLGKIARQEGETVHPGDVLATITEGTRAAAAPANARADADKPAPSTSTGPALPNASPGTPRPPGMAAEAAEADRPHASPVARRMAEEHGLDLASVEGTGTGGRVTREDVERHLGAAASPAAPAAASKPPLTPEQPSTDGARRETHIRMSRRRQTIAQRLLEAQRTAAMLTTFNEVDMSAIMEVRARRREAFLKRNGVGLGFMSFFTKAVVSALQAFPNLNAEIRGDEIVQKHYYDIGIAVGAAGGLVVPIVRDADRKSFAELERDVAQLAEKARSNTLTLEDLRGGTFTITNGGVYGSLMSTPILSLPQVGILGMHTIKPRPIAVDGQVVIRPMMYLALTYDHRIVDGSEAVQFLVRIKELIEDPAALLLEG